MLVRILSIGLGIVMAFGVITWWALEWSGVAIVETRTPDGSTRSTHVWFAEHEGELWLEAGTPENPWYLDVQRDPALVLDDGHTRARYVALPIPTTEAHDRLRAVLRAKYGFRDWWVGGLIESSASVAVRLEADPAPPRDVADLEPTVD